MSARDDAIRAVIHSAIRAGLPARYRLNSRQAATAWRHQFYRLRKRSSDPSFAQVMLVIEEAEPHVILIKPIEGTLVAADGSQVEVVGAPSDELFDAESLAAEIGIKLGEE